MNITKKILLTIIIFTGFSINLFSQSGSSASVGATIQQPVLITKSAVINFETVAIIIAGEVKLVRGRISSKKPTIMLPVPEGTFTAASFYTEGTSSYSFSFSVPSSPLEIKSGNNTYIVNTFMSDPIINPETNLFGGVYVSVTPLNVIVNYN